MIAADAFLRTILEHPEDDGPRLVYADWLEEHGEPHAELIRLQCHLARLSADDPQRESLQERVEELILEYDSRWLQPVRDLGLSARFRRGFLEVKVSGVRTFLETSNRLFSMPWILHAHLQDAGADVEDIAELAASPHLTRLQKLDLRRSQVGNEGAFKLSQSPHRCRLTHLLLSHVSLSSMGLKALVEQMDFSRLVDLQLSHNGIGAVGAKALSLSPRLRSLRTLDLSYNQLGTIGGEYLAESPYLSQLQALFVRGNSIGVKGKKALRRRFGPRVHLGSSENPF